MLRGVSKRPWYVAESGTRYVRDKAPPKPPREPDPDEVSIKMRDWLQADGNAGDIDLAVLLAVRNMLRTESGWTPHARALNGSGTITEVTSRDARRWSILGAVMYVTHTFMDDKKRRLVIEMIKRCLPADCRAMPLFRWEEQARHSQVLHLLNMAISIRKKDLGYL